MCVCACGGGLGFWCLSVCLFLFLFVCLVVFGSAAGGCLRSLGVLGRMLLLGLPSSVRDWSFLHPLPSAAGLLMFWLLPTNSSMVYPASPVFCRWIGALSPALSPVWWTWCCSACCSGFDCFFINLFVRMRSDWHGQCARSKPEAMGRV